MGSITLVTFPPVIRLESDPLMREFSPGRTETSSRVAFTPPLLASQPGMISLQAKLGAAAESLLRCVEGDGHAVQSLAVTVHLGDDVPPISSMPTPLRLLVACQMALKYHTGEGHEHLSARTEDMVEHLRLAVEFARAEGWADL